MRPTTGPMAGELGLATASRARTNATVWRRGTRSTAPALGRPPTRVDYWSGVERWAVELAAAALVVGVAWVYFHGHRVGVVRGLVAGACLAAAGAGWWAVGRALSWRHRVEVVEPLAAALHGLVGRHETEAPGHYLSVPADFAEAGGQPVRIRLPLGFRAVRGDVEAVEAVVSAKLGLPDPSFSWSASGRRPHVLVRPRHHPPDRLYVADASTVELLAAQPESAPLTGVAAAGQLVAVDLDSESPHVLISAAPGGGKSALVRSLTAQLLRHGATASFLDFKQGSHPWVRGVEGVEYLRHMLDMHDALVRLGAEIEARSTILGDWTGEGDPPFRRHLVVVEESNACLSRLARWWERNRDRSDPKWSPATDALSDALFLGRQLKISVILVAQSATARALGGPEVRECFTARVMAGRYTRQAWGMLCGDVQPMPPPTRHHGRCQVVIGGQARATQGVFFTDDEAHAWATAGDRPRLVDAFHLGESAPSVLGRPALHLVEPGPGQHLVTLREAVAEGILGVSLAVAKRESTRDPGFPAPALRGRVGTANRWRPGDLGRWERNRPRADVEGLGL